MRDSITSTRLRELLSYDEQTGLFTWKEDRYRFKCNGKVAGNVRPDGYVGICIDTCRYLAHRLAWLYMTGEWPAHFLDHRDMDRANNRFANLREVTNKQNMENKHRQANTSSGFMGVSWMEKQARWQVYITHNGKRIALGWRRDLIEACALRLRAERERFTHSPRVLA